MKTLLYACLWYKQKERTWSGTAWSLRQALDPYFSIQDFAIRDPLYRKVMRRVKYRLRHQKEFHKPAPPGDRLRLALLCRKGEVAVLQFADWPDRKDCASYVYQDLAIAAICRLRERDPESFRYCEYEGIPKEVLRRQAREQLAFYGRCRAVFTMSRWLRDFLIQECGLPERKVHAVGGGIQVDASRIREDLRTGNKILFVGRAFERKGGVLLLEAYEKLREALPEAELYLAGASPETVRKCYPKPLSESVHIMGEVSAEELSELYNRCDVFCMPSYFEAYGLVFAEALTYGLPCVARDKFAMREMIEDGVTGRLLPDADAGQLEEALREVLQEPRFGENVRQRRAWYLEEYSWDSVARRIVRVIASGA